MNGLERILAAVSFKPTDRIPAIPLVFGHAATLANVRLDDYLRDGALLARCQMSAQARYGSDAVYAYMDAFVETEAIGSKLNYHANLYPDVETYILKCGDDPFQLKIPDPEQDGRMPEVLKAAGLLRKQVGDRLIVAGVVEGPMSLAVTLIGLEDALYCAADHPDLFERVLDYAAEVAIRYGTAQIHAGIHVPVVFDPPASQSVVPPAFFREFILPRYKRIFAAFAQAGAPSWIMIPGAIRALLPYLDETGLNIVSFDYEVSAAEAQAALPHACLAGNLKPVDFVLNSPEQVFRDASALRDAFAARGGFLLSSGSEIPLEAKPENVDAMIVACGES